jgi:RNA polymerase sigma-70 factor, ECF subfamily
MLIHSEIPAISAGIIAAMPSLRRYALSLCRTTDRADDLMQETLLKAWLNHERFQAGSNLNAWLFTILRNAFLDENRKHNREVQYADSTYSAKLHSYPAHDATLDLSDFLAALTAVPKLQREALVLVGALGHSYEEAACLMGTAPGTVKSRVSRARQHLK